MSSGQVFALLWGPFAIAFGVTFIVQRARISELARRQRRHQGLRVSQRTQSPALMAVSGALLVVLGICVLIGALIGQIR
ncbi:hypothetical protein RCH22_002163 [Cryobacterium psychrotolerans]|nr:hypothetical protein [Cryobacterium psychrotolerans]